MVHGFRMICKLDLSWPPRSLRPHSNKGTVGTEIKLPLAQDILPILEVKPQIPAASKAPGGSSTLFFHPQTATKTSLLPSLPSRV